MAGLKVKRLAGLFPATPSPLRPSLPHPSFRRRPLPLEKTRYVRIKLILASLTLPLTRASRMFRRIARFEALSITQSRL